MELKEQYNVMGLVEFIRNYYPHYSTQELSKVMGMRVSRIYNLAYRLGVKKSPGLIAQQLEEQAQRLKTDGIMYRYKKGHTPHNKGKKLPSELYEKAKATMFKKGNSPHNTKPVGSEVITKDGYIRVKIAHPNTWELKHRFVWEQANGPIPKGYNIQFKDGNITNTAIDNLYIISRSEQIDQNSITRYPAEIRRAIYRVSKLKKTIKQYETN